MTKDLSNDWRLTNQLKYLKRETLLYSKWVTLDESWDHDHCEFCWETIDSSTENAYCTTDYYHWICPECYNDFKEMFGWVLDE
ncbi:MAG: hypothetical protein FWG02_06240 [Holophagaceae bacterium]|nr:hypothetical protein [Holophagaceae bacterium]